MILVDSSVWIDHLRIPSAVLVELLRVDQVLCHPFIVGELLVGSLKDRQRFIQSLETLPQAIVAREDEVVAMVESERIYGKGVGYLDMHLLASLQLSRPARLWTRDRRFFALAKQIDLASDYPVRSAYN